jgi:hypothetical protein
VDRLCHVNRWTPDTRPSDAHRSEAEAVNLDFATDPERACFTGVELRHGHFLLRSSDDLDRSADREAELAIRAPLIDGDFNKPV